MPAPTQCRSPGCVDGLRRGTRIGADSSAGHPFAQANPSPLTTTRHPTVPSPMGEGRPQAGVRSLWPPLSRARGAQCGSAAGDSGVLCALAPLSRARGRGWGWGLLTARTTAAILPSMETTHATYNGSFYYYYRQTLWLGRPVIATRVTE
jgi:hypothetical protein